MNCAEFTDYFGRNTAIVDDSPPPEVMEHLFVCPGCKALWNFMTRSHLDGQMPIRLRGSIVKAMRDDLRPVSPVPAGIMLVLGFVISFTLLVLAAVSVTGVQGAVTLQNWQHFGVLLVLGAGAVVLAVVLSREMVPAERSVISPGRAAVGVAVSLALSLALLFPWKVEDQFMAMGWHCGRRGLLFALPAALLFLLVLRRGTVLSPAAAGSLTGLLAGLVGVAVLHFNCIIHNAPHLVAWHAAVPLACAGAGYLVGQYLWIVWPPAYKRLDSKQQAGGSR